MAITNREKEGRRKKIEKIRVSKKKKERKKGEIKGLFREWERNYIITFKIGL
jgi:hypothetical protein